MMSRFSSRAARVFAVALLTLAASAGSALAHAYPISTDPQTNARLDGPPGHIGITYDSPIDGRGSPLVLMDWTGSVVPTASDKVDGNTRVSVAPTTDLGPGPYTVAWTSLSAEDGHAAQGFYTFVVSGGSVGLLNGTATSQTAAADLTATLSVTTAGDGGSLLRVDLNNTSGVERVRIRLSRPDVGSDLLGDNVRRAMGPARHRPKHRQTLGRDLDTVIAKDFGKIINHDHVLCQIMDSVKIRLDANIWI